MTEDRGAEREEPPAKAAAGARLVVWILFLGALAWAAYGWFGG